MEKLRLEDLSWTEVHQAIRSGIDTVVLMLGSIEQHGPHLPLSTDSLIAQKLGLEIVCRLGNALLAPIIKTGVSFYHMDFPGTITIRKETLVSIIIDFSSSLIKHGFTNIVMIPTHDGNADSIEEAVKLLQKDFPEIKFIRFSNSTGYLNIISEKASKYGISAEIIGPHAGEGETSMVLAIRPDLVDLSKAEQGYMGNIEEARKIVLEKGTKALTSNGIFGDAKIAETERGKDYIESIVEFYVQYIRRNLNKK